MSWLRRLLWRRKRLRSPSGPMSVKTTNGTFTLSFQSSDGLWETSADIPHDADVQTISVMVGRMDGPNPNIVLGEN